MNSKLEDLYQDYWQIHSDKLLEGYDPSEIAGVLAAHAMTIYKTILSPEDYEKIVDSISNQRDNVQSLTNGVSWQ